MIAKLKRIVFVFAMFAMSHKHECMHVCWNSYKIKFRQKPCTFSLVNFLSDDVLSIKVEERSGGIIKIGEGGISEYKQVGNTSSSEATVNQLSNYLITTDKRLMVHVLCSDNKGINQTTIFSVR